MLYFLLSGILQLWKNGDYIKFVNWCSTKREMAINCYFGNLNLNGMLSGGLSYSISIPCYCTVVLLMIGLQPEFCRLLEVLWHAIQVARAFLWWFGFLWCLDLWLLWNVVFYSGLYMLEGSWSWGKVIALQPGLLCAGEVHICYKLLGLGTWFGVMLFEMWIIGHVVPCLEWFLIEWWLCLMDCCRISLLL